MYRIQKAVLKAKKNSNPSERTVKKLGPQPRVDSPLEQLTYSQTKVMPIQPEKLEAKRVVSGFSTNDKGQLFRTLRTQILQNMRKNNWQSLGITSAKPGEGKSTIAANLAVAIAREVNQTVLLVDLDLANPSMAESFQIKPELGLLDYLEGNAKLGDVMLNPGIERLVMVPGRGHALNSAELISSPKMVSFFKETKNRYKSRFILFDMPAVLPTDDVLSCIPHVDSSLLVVEDGKNSKKELERAMNQLRGAPFMGYVLNRFHRGRWLF